MILMVRYRGRGRNLAVGLETAKMLLGMKGVNTGGGSQMTGEQAGYSFKSLVCRIVDITHERYFGVPAPRGT